MQAYQKQIHQLLQLFQLLYSRHLQSRNLEDFLVSQCMQLCQLQQFHPARIGKHLNETYYHMHMIDFPITFCAAASPDTSKLSAVEGVTPEDGAQ